MMDGLGASSDVPGVDFDDEVANANEKPLAGLERTSEAVKPFEFCLRVCGPARIEGDVSEAGVVSPGGVVEVALNQKVADGDEGGVDGENNFSRGLVSMGWSAGEFMNAALTPSMAAC